MPKIKIPERELEVYYEIRGKGPPLFLITGLLGSIDFYWQVLAPHLANDFQLIMFDNRASGQTLDEGNPFTLEDMADDVSSLINHLGFERVHLFGHSLGSMVAQVMTDRHKAKVDKVILCNPLTRMYKLCELIFAAMIDLLHSGANFSKVLMTLIPWMYSEAFIMKHLDKLKLFSDRFRFEISDAQRQCGALLHANTASILQRISHETLVIASAEDLLTPTPYAEEISQKIPLSSFSIIPGGHASNIEHPKELTTLIRDFLKSS